MRGRKGTVALLALALLGALVGVAGAGTTAGPDPVVEEWPEWPYPTSCGTVPFDPVEVFSGPTRAERGSKPSEVALRRFLRKQKWVTEFVPKRNWRLLAENRKVAEFASGRLSSPYGPGTMSFRRAKGRWKWSSLSSGCTPTSIVDGEAAISWTLDPRGPLPGPESHEIWIELGPGPCSGGKSQNYRARKPIFWQMGDKMLMLMRLRPLPPGAYTCQGISEPPLKVQLPSPPGGMRLYDGGTYPPGDVVRTWQKQQRAG
jgi:hypothetical protein